MNVGPDGFINEFEEKPAHPKSNLASMGIYIFTWQKLRSYLLADEADPTSDNDFGKHIIHHKKILVRHCVNKYTFHTLTVIKKAF